MKLGHAKVVTEYRFLQYSITTDTGFANLA